jgi:hypothetical protein
MHSREPVGYHYQTAVEFRGDFRDCSPEIGRLPEECRTLADCFTSPTCRKQLTELAQSYDRMAVTAVSNYGTRELLIEHSQASDVATV